MKLSVVVLLLVAACSAEHILVKQSYSSCTSCDEECTDLPNSIYFMMPGTCHKSGGGYSYSYTLGDVNVMNYYTSDDCSGTPAGGEIFEQGDCEDTGGNQDVSFILEDWCQMTEGPTGEFIHPVFTRHVFSPGSDCVAENSAVVLHQSLLLGDCSLNTTTTCSDAGDNATTLYFTDGTCGIESFEIVFNTSECTNMGHKISYSCPDTTETTTLHCKALGDDASVHAIFPTNNDEGSDSDDDLPADSTVTPYHVLLRVLYDDNCTCGDADCTNHTLEMSVMSNGQCVDLPAESVAQAGGIMSYGFTITSNTSFTRSYYTQAGCAGTALSSDSMNSGQCVVNDDDNEEWFVMPNWCASSKTQSFAHQVPSFTYYLTSDSCNATESFSSYEIRPPSVCVVDLDDNEFESWSCVDGNFQITQYSDRSCSTISETSSPPSSCLSYQGQSYMRGCESDMFCKAFGYDPEALIAADLIAQAEAAAAAAADAAGDDDDDGDGDDDDDGDGDDNGTDTDGDDGDTNSTDTDGDDGNQTSSSAFVAQATVGMVVAIVCASLLV